ncbi:4-hydroxyphenylpyruvate dioxygenase [Halotydeus destructor]|nr:4-hydroxyphenylpyruvate dioxygenase [Halotydeus destructor]
MTVVSKSSVPINGNEPKQVDRVDRASSGRLSDARPGQCLNFDHITFWVGNAKQSASLYCVQFGFEPLAYKGLETGSRQFARHAVRQGSVTFVFVSPLNPGDADFGHFLSSHGDAVKDIAFVVDDVELVLSLAKERGAQVVKDIWQEEDQDGCVKMATVKTYGDVTHTLVQRIAYTGLFLPGYKPSQLKLSLLKNLSPVNFDFIDHCVDDVNVRTGNTALNFIVVANDTETIKLNILEPAEAKNKSQVTEFNDYNGGPGVQHIAIHTSNIVDTIATLRSRGLEFLGAPKAYYQLLRQRLALSKVTVTESIDDLEANCILLDFDDNGYLLQIFTKPVQDRPTLFFEIIQRYNHNGFGAGNFKALFEAVEFEQAQRGNF